MSVAVMLQALGWVSVFWLVTVHLLIQHGRLRADSWPYRAAGCAAAVSVVAASAAEEIWPVAVLGLLWLRIEVFGHRQHVPEPLPDLVPLPEQVERVPAKDVVLPREPVLAGGRKGAHRPQAHKPLLPQVHKPELPHPHLPHPHVPHPHVPHPHLGRRAVDRVFKIEMGVVIVIAAVLFVLWAEEQRTSFRSTTDYVVCNWIDGC